MIEPEVKHLLVRNGTMSANAVAIGLNATTLTGAERTRIIVERTIEALEANGLITVVPADEWPDFYIPDPPYRSPWG